MEEEASGSAIGRTVVRRGRRPRLTLDGQLVGYWDREAARLDALAAEARFGWIGRRYARKAVKARALADRSRVRETARGNEPALEDDADS